jgi:hypothetical protein
MSHEPRQLNEQASEFRDDDHVVFIGKRATWDGDALFGLRAEDRRRHLFVVGQTGTGKSALLENIVIQEAHANRGCGLVDPHGDTADRILNQLPPSRGYDLVVFDASDVDYPPGLNLLAVTDADSRPLTAANIVSTFRSLWNDSWGPRLEFLLFNAVSALLECQNTTMLGLPRLLRDDSYRAWVLRQVKDPVILAFWNEFAGYDLRYRREITMPIENKVGQLLTPILRNIVGQVRNRLDIRQVIDRRRIFIAKLAKGRIGQAAANLLGALLITQFQQAALSRADVPENERIDFNLIVDEFWNFSTDSFTSMLSETRKYALNLTLGTQFIEQTTPEVLGAILGNVGSIVCFRVSPRDAAILSRHIGGHFDESMFTNLDNYEIVAKVLMSGKYPTPFLAKTLPPLAMNYNRRESLIRHSRQRYCTPRAVVEARIARWMRRS